MTSIAESRPAARGGRWRALLLIGLLVLLSAGTPSPWAGLWLLVPGAASATLLLAWRFGKLAWLLPLGLAVAVVVVDGPGSLWAWWVPTAAATGAWMGLREESGSASGDRAWMLMPMLALAAAMPWLVHYPQLVAAVERWLALNDAQLIDLFRQLGYGGERLASLERAVGENAKLRVEALPRVLPTVLFVWAALLVSAGRSLASRGAGLLRWPALRRASLRDWRLPDGALWTLIVGLGLLVSPWNAWAPTAWTLLLNAGLGFCVQGVAVVESLMLARGVPLSIILLTLLFVLTIAMPVFVVTTAALGLSDVWLDFRRLEATPEGDGA